MKIGLINIGNELLNGQTLNSHHQWIARQATGQGWILDHQQTITDSPEAIVNAIDTAIGVHDLVIATGGLGPTSDDITRDVVAKYFQVSLEPDKAVELGIREYFARRKRPMPESVLVQAMVPAGAEVLFNHFGTAPGLVMRHREKGGWLAMLPGPPRELYPMFTDQLVPFIRKMLVSEVGYYCRVLRTVGIGESRVQELIESELAGMVEQGLEIGYCARTGEVDVRLATRKSDGSNDVDAAVETVRRILGSAVFAEGEDSLEKTVVGSLITSQLTVATAESCTGGFLGHRLTMVPGASEVYLGGAITYSNAEKIRQLGVDPGTLDKLGAVSEEVARQMAEGIRRVTGADFGLSTTGIAGPGGGSDEKPVGLVYMAVAGPGRTEVFHRINTFDRETFKFVTTQQVLDCLRRMVDGCSLENMRPGNI